MGTQVGHDDQILIDPAAQGVVAPVSEDFLTATTQALVRWGGIGLNRVDLQFNASGTTYGPKLDEEDRDLRLAGSVRHRLGQRTYFDGSLVGRLFRRGEGSEFDLDRLRPEARFNWAHGTWLLTLSLEKSWVRFPGRDVVVDSTTTETESQSQTDTGLGIVRSVGARGYVASEALYRRVDSNFDAAEYGGPSVTLRGGMTWSLWDVSTYVVYGHRQYDDPVSDLEDPAIQMERQDDTWEVGLTVEWSILRRVDLMADGSLVHQQSTVNDFDFDQARVSIGFTVDIVDTRPARAPQFDGARPALAPRGTPSGVLFRVRAPEAKSVTVAGSWSGWDAGLHWLQGPDAEGVWSLVVRVPSGTWRYAFVVDGVWTKPPDATRYEDDGFGGVHGVLQVGSP